MIVKIEKFGADWCGPCKVLEKTLDELQKKHPQLQIERFNVDEMDEQVIGELKIRNIPVIRFIDETGHEVKRLLGAQSLNTLESELS